MGVSHLWTILEPVRKQQSLAELSGSMLAVDLSMWIMESKSTKHLASAVQKPHLRNLFFRISTLYKLGVKLVFVIDGKPPDIKSATIKRRLQSKKDGDAVHSAKIGPIKRSRFQVIVNECVQLLDCLGVPYVRGEGEAEALCAFLNQQGIVSGCITDDGDAFLYGAIRVCRNFTLNTKDPHVDSYCMQDVEKKLNLDREKLIGLAVLLGCDYFPKGVPGVGPVSAVSFLQKLFMERVNVLERFDEWVKRRSEVLPNVNKPTHCSRCQHPGSKREHTQSGCHTCGSLKMCFVTDENVNCSCDWHSSESERLEVAIRSKAIKTEGFPAQAAVGEFLVTRDRLPNTDFVWKQPCFKEFMRVAVDKMNWTAAYSAEKIFPLMTRWQMLQIEHSSLLLKPYRIVKARVKKRVPSLEIEWHKPDTLCIPGDYVITIEPLDLFCKAFEEMFSKFQAEVNSKKKPKSKKQGKIVMYDQRLTQGLTDITNTGGLLSQNSPKNKVAKSRKTKCKLKDSWLKSTDSLKTCNSEQCENKEVILNNESVTTVDVTECKLTKFRGSAVGTRPIHSVLDNEATSIRDSDCQRDILENTSHQTWPETIALNSILESDNEPSPLPLALRIKINQAAVKYTPDVGTSQLAPLGLAVPGVCDPEELLSRSHNESVIIINSDAEESFCQKPSFVEGIVNCSSTPAVQPAMDKFGNLDQSVMCIEKKSLTFMDEGFVERFSSLSVSHPSLTPATCHFTCNGMVNESGNLSKELFGTPL